jgi:hypothetical protein
MGWTDWSTIRPFFSGVKPEDAYPASEVESAFIGRIGSRSEKNSKAALIDP